MKKRDGKLELLEVLPRKEEVFVCEDPGRMDIYGKPMDNIRIEVRFDGRQVWYFCYGDLEDGSSTCFGAELSMEGAYKVIMELIPCNVSADKRAKHPDPAPEESPADAPIEVEVAFLVSSEELHDLVSTYDEWEKLRCRVNPASHRLGMDIPELYHLLAITGHDVMLREVKEFRETLEARAKMESQEEDSGYREDCAGCQYLKQVGDDFECKAPAEEIMTGSVPCDSKHVPDPDRQKLKEEVRQAYLNGGHTGYLHDDDGNEYYTTRDGIRHYTRLEG